MKSYAGQSQTIDTICFPTETVRKILIAAEQKKILDQQVIILNERIAGYQQTVKELGDKDAASVAGYEMQIKEMLSQRGIYEDQLKSYERLLRKEKRKRWFTSAGGVLLTGIFGYLYLTK